MRCKNCGAPVEVAGNRRWRACGYCGAAPPLTATLLERLAAKTERHSAPQLAPLWPPLGEPGKVAF